MKQKVILTLWPSFLMAILMEGIVFSLIDPIEFDIFGFEMAEHRLAAYSAGFFLFWAFGAACSALTIFFQHSANEINRFCPLPEICPVSKEPPLLD